MTVYSLLIVSLLYTNTKHYKPDCTITITVAVICSQSVYPWAWTFLGACTCTQTQWLQCQCWNLLVFELQLQQHSHSQLRCECHWLCPMRSWRWQEQELFWIQFEPFWLSDGAVAVGRIMLYSTHLTSSIETVQTLRLVTERDNSIMQTTGWKNWHRPLLYLTITHHHNQKIAALIILPKLGHNMTHHITMRCPSRSR